MKQTNLPISLLNETSKYARVHILDTEPFSSVFGKKKTRKRPALKVRFIIRTIVQTHSKFGFSLNFSIILVSGSINITGLL